MIGANDRRVVQVASECFRLVDEKFLDDVRIGHDQDVGHPRAEMRDVLIVREAGNRLDVVAHQGAQAEQAERARRRLERNEIGYYTRTLPHWFALAREDSLRFIVSAFGHVQQEFTKLFLKMVQLQRPNYPLLPFFFLEVAPELGSIVILRARSNWER